MKTTIFWAGLCEGSKVDVSKRFRETDQDKNLSKRLIQSIPKRFLALIYAERKQTSKWTILIMNEFLAIFCKILCNRHQCNSFIFLRVHHLPNLVCQFSLCEETGIPVGSPAASFLGVDLYSFHIRTGFESHREDPTKSPTCGLKADFHSVQNVARSTFSERFLLNYKQSSGTNLISCG